MSNQTKIPFICIYENYLDSFNMLSSEEVGNLVLGLLTYLRTGEQPHFPGNERFLWPWLRDQMDRDRAAYQRRCDASRSNGQKGGRPKSVSKETVADESETCRLSEEPKKPKNKNNNNNNDSNNDSNNDNEKNNDKEKKNAGELTGEAVHIQEPTSAEVCNRENSTDRDANCQRTEDAPPQIFVPPSLEELGEYVNKMGYPLDPEAIYDHYTAVGWKVGGNPMEDWRAAVRSWMRKEKNYGRNQKNTAPAISSVRYGIHL